jgi:Cd2+/Zn2+-exporting ATPase
LESRSRAVREAIQEYIERHTELEALEGPVVAALATETVDVAMGAAGTDTAVESADVALMGDELWKLPYLYALSGKANGVIRQNIWASIGVKALLAVGVPFGLVNVAVAVVVGDMGMSLGVTTNALRLARLKPDSFE